MARWAPSAVCTCTAAPACALEPWSVIQRGARPSVAQPLAACFAPFAPSRPRLREDGAGNQHGGYSLVTNSFWLFWTHGPVGWQGTNKVGGNVNILNAWKIPGDVAREAGAKLQSPDVWTRHAILLCSARIHLTLRPNSSPARRSRNGRRGQGRPPRRHRIRSWSSLPGVPRRSCGVAGLVGAARRLASVCAMTSSAGASLPRRMVGLLLGCPLCLRFAAQGACWRGRKHPLMRGLQELARFCVPNWL